MAITVAQADGKLYTMKEVCQHTGMTYEALKFYCNSGLVPGLQRDENNHRVFDSRALAWLEGLYRLKRCGLGIKEMRRYTELCLEGESSIPERKAILKAKREELEMRLIELQDCMAYIDEKQAYYDAVLAGREAYCSNVINTNDD